MKLEDEGQWRVNMDKEMRGLCEGAVKTLVSADC
jgi:hypothetical protein